MADRSNAEGFVDATLGQRFGGRLVDGVVLFAVSLPLLFVLGPVSYRVAAIVIAGTYEIVAIAVWGQTVGKHIAGTQVVSTISGPMAPAQAVVRFLAYGGIVFVLNVVTFPIVGLLWALAVAVSIVRGREHRGLHDLAARTVVVSAPARRAR